MYNLNGINLIKINKNRMVLYIANPLLFFDKNNQN